MYTRQNNDINRNFNYLQQQYNNIPSNQPTNTNKFLYVGGVVLGLGLIIGGVYYYKKNKK